MSRFERRALAGLMTGLSAVAVMAAAVAWGDPDGRPEPAPVPRVDRDTVDAPDDTRGGQAPPDTITLAFAGDMHFELHLAALLDHPRGALGPITHALAGADLAMVNLESAIAGPGRTPEAKELEVPSNRYWFRTSPAALDVLGAAGVDVVTMANNHGADYGPLGLQDTLRAVRHGPVHVVGVGPSRRAAFTPYRVAVKGITFAFFGADASFREGASSVWAARPNTPGLAAAHSTRPRVLLDAVRRARRRADFVVVYLHWGEELQGCPTAQQRTTAQALARAGARVVVGSHAHVLLGSGWLDDTYVDYGLGNFLWYHNQQPESGVLRLRVRDGRVVDGDWVPARIESDGRPHRLTGQARSAAIADWQRLRGCTGLASRPSPDHASPTVYSASVRPIGPRLRERMRRSYHSGCPVPLSDLRYLRMTYLGFDGAAHTGEMVVREEFAGDVVGVFRRLYDARWPIQQMRLVDDYGGDDSRSMAANNTSGYNCRTIAGTHTWSAHAYGAAIDINPVQNPYLTASAVHPPAAARFVGIDRSSAASGIPRGAIREGDVVVRAFARIGWEWGGRWSPPHDYQHFTVLDR